MSSPFINCQSISQSYGPNELFQNLSITFMPNDRVGLIGPNGSGKSTLLKLIGKINNPDSGEIIHNKDVRIGYVPQHIEKHKGTIYEVIKKALNNDIHMYEYNIESHIYKTLEKVGLKDLEQLASTLSGGLARRLTIAKALVNEPNILLLDEPTNHLDLDTILWLEQFLKKYFKNFIVISHDRTFLNNISNKIWELSYRYPEGIFSVDGGYREFVNARTIFLKGQEQYEKSLRSKNRREEEWLKQSPKARSTKSRARIQEAAKIQKELSEVKFRNTENKTQLSFNTSDRQTKKLLVAKNLSKQFGNKKIFSGLDITLMKGDRLGIAGGNGSGKSTLLKILNGEMNSDSGTIKYAEGVKIFYFDQQRESLDQDMTLRDALSPNGDIVSYRGKSIHVNSWCEKFLFSKSRLDLPIKMLSGGERARILIARLMMEEADILLLDEPTNDLDIDTLEILEESLDDFSGCVVLISHDRSITDRITDNLLALDSHGGHLIFNDTESWLQQRAEKTVKKSPAIEKIPTVKKPSLSYEEKKELNKIEKTLIILEEEVKALSALLNDPVLQSDSVTLEKTYNSIMDNQIKLDKLYLRWQELEDKKSH